MCHFTPFRAQARSSLHWDSMSSQGLLGSRPVMFSHRVNINKTRQAFTSHESCESVVCSQSSVSLLHGNPQKKGNVHAFCNYSISNSEHFILVMSSFTSYFKNILDIFKCCLYMAFFRYNAKYCYFPMFQMKGTKIFFPSWDFYLNSSVHNFKPKSYLVAIMPTLLLRDLREQLVSYLSPGCWRDFRSHTVTQISPLLQPLTQLAARGRFFPTTVSWSLLSPLTMWVFLPYIPCLNLLSQPQTSSPGSSHPDAWET